MKIIEDYINRLLTQSTPEAPIWNIEKIHAGAKPKWNYIDGCMMTALLSLHEITGDPKYLEFAGTFIDYYVFDDGTIRGYSVDEYNIDNINEGRVLFDLYGLTKKEKYRKAIDLIYSQLQSHPRTKEGNFWHKAIYPNQVWLDGIYMAQPFYMRYETYYTKHEHYKDIFEQIMNVRTHMFDQEKGLYYHGYDASKSVFWANKETGLSQNFWLRATGWFVVALVDILGDMNNQLFYMYRSLRNLLKEALDGLLQYQDSSGLWFQLVDKAEVEGNYLETSGSAMISYALLKGVRLGLLPERYQDYGLRAFQGIADRYLSEKDGQLQLGGICLVAGLGPEDNLRRDGSVEYYLSEPVVANDAKGVAPFLLAYTEYLRICVR